MTKLYFLHFLLSSHSAHAGPLVCKETVETKDGLTQSDRYVLRGVTSWGQGCAFEGYPGVYGRVHSVLSWIRDTMDDKAVDVAGLDS